MGHHLVKEFITDEFKTPVSKVLNDALKGVSIALFEFPLFTKNGNNVIYVILSIFDLPSIYYMLSIICKHAAWDAFYLSVAISK